MNKHRQDARADNNQKIVVEELRKVGLSVELDHDDLLIGCNFIKWLPLTFWVELKNPKTAFDKDGRIWAKDVKKSQRDILRTWKGHYLIASSFDEIMEEIEKTIEKVMHGKINN